MKSWKNSIFVVSVIVITIIGPLVLIIARDHNVKLLSKSENVFFMWQLLMLAILFINLAATWICLRMLVDQIPTLDTFVLQNKYKNLGNFILTILALVVSGLIELIYQFLHIV
jgi:hypothetical protein